MEEPVSGEVVVEPPAEEQEPVSLEGTEMVVSEPPAPSLSVTLFQTTDPSEVVVRAARVADALHSVIQKQNLTTRIGDSEHVQVEGWQACGSMVGVFPVPGAVRVIPWPETTPTGLRELKERGLDFGYIAEYTARTITGATVGGGSATCKRTEFKWRKKDDQSLLSMAQTRAQSKALKSPLSFIVTMAGYNPTPAEEMVSDEEAPYGQPKYGPPYDASLDNLQKLQRALAFLTGSSEGADELREQLTQDAGYMPRVVGRALLLTARYVRDRRLYEEKVGVVEPTVDQSDIPAEGGY